MEVGRTDSCAFFEQTDLFEGKQLLPFSYALKESDDVLATELKNGSLIKGRFSFYCIDNVRATELKATRFRPKTHFRSTMASGDDRSFPRVKIMSALLQLEPNFNCQTNYLSFCNLIVEPSHNISKGPVPQEGTVAEVMQTAGEDLTWC